MHPSFFFLNQFDGIAQSDVFFKPCLQTRESLRSSHKTSGLKMVCSVGVLAAVVVSASPAPPAPPVFCPGYTLIDVGDKQDEIFKRTCCIGEPYLQCLGQRLAEVA